MFCVVLTSVFVQFTIYESYLFFIIVFIIILNHFYDFILWPLFVIFVSLVRIKTYRSFY